MSGVLRVRGYSPAPADAVRVRVSYFREFEQFTLWANHCCKTDIAPCHIYLSQEGGWVDALVEGIVMAINLLMEITIPLSKPQGGWREGFTAETQPVMIRMTTPIVLKDLIEWVA